MPPRCLSTPGWLLRSGCLLLIVACTGGGCGGKDPAGGDGGAGDGGAGDGGTSDGGSGDGGTTDSGSTTPRALALVFTSTPAAQVTAGEGPGSLAVALQDADSGALVPEVELVVSLSSEGAALSGTTEVALVDGEARFEDLRLSGCGEGALVASAVVASEEDPLVAAARSEAVAVSPLVTVLARPGPAAVPGPLDPLQVALQDALGAPVDLALSLSDAGSEGVSLAGEVASTTTAGIATFDALEATGTGSLALTLQGPEGCPLASALPGLRVGADLRHEPLFLPAARVGEDYLAALPWTDLLLDPLPEGLSLEGGAVLGLPTTSGAALVQGAAWEGDVPGGTVVAVDLRLAVFPALDADLPAPTLDPAAEGPWPDDALELTIPSITTSRGTTRDVRLRVAFPSDGKGGLAAGRHPVVAFHHAAHSPTDIYDDYTDLHGHWASHGVIVASVDSSVNVSGVSQSWQNLVDMSTFQLAALDHLALLDQDATSPLQGHVDTTRAFVSGHSRGGGASLVSLWREPSLLGALCFEPVSPLQTPSQDWDDPEGNGDRAFPTRPVLLLSAALDLDEPWPLVDVSYEQTVGPALLVTLHGSNHEDTYDAGTPGSTTSSSTIPVADRHDLDQHYTTAFLRRFGGAGEPAGDLSYDLALFGAASLSSDLSTEGVSVTGRRHAARTSLVDDYQGAEEENLWGGLNLSSEVEAEENGEPYEEGLRAVGRYDERGLRIATWALARRLSWTSPDAELATWLDPAGAPVDLSAWDAVALRLARDCPSPYSGPCPDLLVDVELALWDADGNEALVALSEGMGTNGIVGRHWSTARIPLGDLAGVDLSRVEGIALRLGARGWTEGDLWIDDLRLE